MTWTISATTLRRYLADEPYRRLTDDDLWARFRDHREEGAFRVLLERIGGRIYARCRAVLRDDADAEEAFQEAFCALFRHRAKLPTYRAAVAWLYQTATNQARKQRRWWWRSCCGTGGRSRTPEATAQPPGEPGPTGSSGGSGGGAGRAAGAGAAGGRAGLPGGDDARRGGRRRWAGRGGRSARTCSRGLERLRRKLAATGLSVAGAAAVEAALRADVPALAPERLARLADALWAKAGTAAGVPGSPYWLSGWKPTAVALTTLGAAAGVWWGASAHAPAPPPPPAAPAQPETLMAKNLRLFEADVRPRLQAALDSLVTGEGGTAVITGVEAQGTRIWVMAELRHGKPQLHTSRLDLNYCTHNRRRQFFLDPWGTEVYGSVNPRDKVVLSKNRVGAPDLTAPLDGFGASWPRSNGCRPTPAGRTPRPGTGSLSAGCWSPTTGTGVSAGTPAVRRGPGRLRTDRRTRRWTGAHVLEAPGFVTAGDVAGPPAAAGRAGGRPVPPVRAVGRRHPHRLPADRPVVGPRTDPVTQEHPYFRSRPKEGTRPCCTSSADG